MPRPVKVPASASSSGILLMLEVSSTPSQEAATTPLVPHSSRRREIRRGPRGQRAGLRGRGLRRSKFESEVAAGRGKYGHF